MFGSVDVFKIKNETNTLFRQSSQFKMAKLNDRK